MTTKRVKGNEPGVGDLFLPKLSLAHPRASVEQPSQSDTTHVLARPTVPRFGRANHPLLLIIPLMIGASQVYGALSVQALPHEREFFAGVVAAAVVTILGGLKLLQLPPRVRNILLIFMIMSALYLFAGTIQPVWFFQYVVGDFFALALPLILLIAFFAEPLLLRSPKVLAVLGLLLFAAALIAHYYGSTAARSDPPDVLLITMCWVLALRGGRTFHFLVGSVSVGIVGYLAYSSGYRTHVVLWLLAGPLVCLLLRGLKPTLAAACFLIALVLAASVAGHPLQLGNHIQASRFATLTGNGDDASLQARWDEAKDVESTARAQWVSGQFLVGGGFGATYIPARSLIIQNLNDKGTVHNIHIGPVMIVYRYGISGLIWLLALICVILGFLWRIARRPTRGVDLGPTIFVASAALYIVDFCMRNSTVQPTMAFSMAAVLYLWCLRPSAPKISRTMR